MALTVTKKKVKEHSKIVTDVLGLVLGCYVVAIPPMSKLLGLGLGVGDV